MVGTRCEYVSIGKKKNYEINFRFEVNVYKVLHVFFLNTHSNLLFLTKHNNARMRRSQSRFSTPEPKSQVSFSDRNLSVVRPPRGYYKEIVKIHWRHLKIFSWTTGPFSTKPDTKYSWVKGLQLSYSNEGLCPFSRGDNKEILKMHWWNLKNFFSRTIGPISIKLDTKHRWAKGIQVYYK